MTRRALLDTRGAASVCAVFFALFLCACAFAVHATYEAIAYRENLQDAADAAAFIGAVIEAKSMNLIVLIHVVMAVLLAIMVGLRLVETLCIVATGICSALSVPTYGASLAFVPTLAELTNQVHDATEQVKDAVNNLLPVLHDAANLVAQTMPLLANARVLGATRNSYGVAAGLAIPNQMSLPVEDGTFGQLCRKAGDYAGNVVAIPFKIIPPVAGGVQQAVEAIVAAGPEWFCGGGERGKPTMERNSKAGWVGLPKTRSQGECETSSDTDARKRSCDQASVEQLAATPARDGSERSGEPLCPTDCEGSSDTRCPPETFSDCAANDPQLQTTDVAWGSGSVPSGDDTPYAQRIAAAREDCAPDGENAAKLRGFSWVERTITRRYRYVREQRAWVEDEELREESATRLQQREDDDSNAPCGPRGLYGQAYERDTEKPLCTGNYHCISSHVGIYWTAGPCARDRPLEVDDAILTEQETEVVDLLGCGYREKAPDAVVPDVDLAAETGGGGDDKVPLALTADAVLGGDAFQVRGLVLASAPLNSMGLDVGRAVLGLKEHEGVGAEVLGFVGRLGAAQAEFYFDWSKLGSGKPDNQKSAADRVAWMWDMGWTARLRPLRLGSSDDSDDDDGGGDDDDDDEGDLGGELGSMSSEMQSRLCERVESCSDIMGAFDLLGGGE